MPPIRLYVLGTLSVQDGESSIHINWREAQTLLVYLAMTGRAHRRDTLASLLWPEADSSKARSELRQNIYTLRQTFGASLLVADKDTAAIPPEAEPLAEGNLSAARAMFRKVLALRGQVAAEAMDGIAELAEMSVQEGQIEDAVGWLALVPEHSYTPYAQRQPAKERLSTLEGELEPDLYAKRLLVGRARPLEEVLSELTAGGVAVSDRG